MSEELKQKIESEIMTAFWSDLKEHAERGAILLVKPEIPLSDVALAIAQDQTKLVEAWLNSGDLGRPDETQLRSWSQTSQKIFRFIIVQPYVLIQKASQ